MGNLTVKKYLVSFEETPYIFTCKPNELERKVEETFKIEQPFQLWVYDDDFKEYVGILNIKELPTRSKLKVVISKYCTMHILQCMNTFLCRFLDVNVATWRSKSSSEKKFDSMLLFCSGIEGCPVNLTARIRN